MDREYWGGVQERVDAAMTARANGTLIRDGLMAAVFAQDGPRKKYSYQKDLASRILTDEVARIKDWDAARNGIGEDGERLKDIKQEIDVCLVIANGGNVDDFLHLSNKKCPFDLAAYDMMASLGYEPFMWEGGKPGDDKAPPLVFPDSGITADFDETLKVGEYLGNGYTYSDNMDRKRESDMDVRAVHSVFRQGDHPVLSNRDRMAGSLEVFKSLGDMGDLAKIREADTYEHDEWEMLCKDMDVAIVCANTADSDMLESRNYVYSYTAMNVSGDEPVFSGTDYEQCPVDERGYQILMDLGYEPFVSGALPFKAPSDYYDTDFLDAQQMRMDRIKADYYLGEDDRNGKLINMAITCHDMGNEWTENDRAGAGDYVRQEFDKLLHPMGDSPQARLNRDRIFDQISAAEVMIATGGNVKGYVAGSGSSIKLLDDECYEMLASYGYENPVKRDDTFGEYTTIKQGDPDREHVAITPEQAAETQRMLSSKFDRHIESPVFDNGEKDDEYSLT